MTTTARPATGSPPTPRSAPRSVSRCVSIIQGRHLDFCQYGAGFFSILLLAFHHCNLRCNAMLQIRPKCQLWSDSADAFLRISKYRVTFQCGATIEKDGGCNHMICKNQACKADFCWVCLGPWEPHGSSWYNCNRCGDTTNNKYFLFQQIFSRYDEDEAKSNRDSQEKSRAALQRYLFYCNRWAHILVLTRYRRWLKFCFIKSRILN